MVLRIHIVYPQLSAFVGDINRYFSCESIQ